MDDAERLKKGKEVSKKVYGSVLQHPEKGTVFSDYAAKTVFAEIWSRDILSMRDKRMLVLGMLAAQGADPALFEIHAKSALLNKEMTQEDLEEACLLFVAYAGYPKASPMYMVTQKLKGEEIKLK